MANATLMFEPYAGVSEKKKVPIHQSFLTSI